MKGRMDGNGTEWRHFGIYKYGRTREAGDGMVVGWAGCQNNKVKTKTKEDWRSFLLGKDPAGRTRDVITGQFFYPRQGRPSTRMGKLLLDGSSGCVWTTTTTTRESDERPGGAAK